MDGGAEEIEYNGSSLVGAQRFYSSPDGTTVVRSSTGTDPVSYETTNQQHTALEAIDATTDAITRRYYDPYGNPVGAQPARWPDNKTYAGQPQDPATSLGLLGARQYNPATGRFLSLDPVFEAGQPTQMGGYTYAANNPITESDPSGLRPPPAAGGCPATTPGCPGYNNNYNPTASPTGGGGGTTSSSSGHTLPGGTDYSHLPNLNHASLGAFEGLPNLALLPHSLTCVGGPHVGVSSPEGPVPPWLLGAGIVVLTLVNVLQGGADPITDTLEGADIAALTSDAATSSAAEGVTSGAARGADFIGDQNGTVVSTSRARLEGGFQDAGFPSLPTRSPGMQYTLPDGSLVRVMEPSGQASLRASFTDPYGNPINPFTGKQPMPPPDMSGAVWRQLMRSLTHVELGP